MSRATNQSEILADDDNHPIAFVHRYDNVVTFDGGGAYLGMAIAAPLAADLRSLARLDEKLRFYLESFFSEHGRQAWQTPMEGKMRIYVKIHQGSSGEAFGIIQDFSDLASNRGVKVVVSDASSN